jgi:hypothetical protein
MAAAPDRIAVQPTLWGTARLVESSSARARLVEAEAFLRALAPGREALVVGASRGAADDLVRRVAAESATTLGLHRFSFTQLAARLASGALAARGLAPTSVLGSEAVAARATFEAQRDDALAYFAPVAGTPGFPKALARTLQELRLAGLDATALEGLPLGGRDLAVLLDRFDAQFAGAAATDRAALFEAATGVLIAGESHWAKRPLLLLDVPVESRAERAFVAALVSACAPVLATAPAGDDAAVEALVGAGAALERIDEGADGDLPRVRRYLFSKASPPTREPAGDLRFFSAPGEGRESVEIARRILEEAQRGVPFDEMAILLRAPQSYLGLLEHALRRAGIPAFYDRGSRRPDPAGRAFLAMLGCAVERLSARRFAEYLSLGQVPQIRVPIPGEAGIPETPVEAWVPPADESLGSGPPETDPVADTDPASPEPRADSDEEAVVAGTLRAPWKWERLIVESAVIGGRERWERRLDGLANEYRLKLREVAREEPDSARVRGLERDLRNLRHLRDFALPVIDRLAAWPASGTWGGWLARFEALAPEVLQRPGHVLRVLADLRPMAEIGPVSLEEARDVLADRLRLLESEPAARRYGKVFVGSPHQARGRTFRVVFVPGLAERMFPQAPREDPMLLDEQRRALDPALPVQHHRLQTERLLLRLAAGAATERLHLSYPRLELAESRPRVPSFYALDVMRAVTGRIPSYESLVGLAAEESRASLAWPAPEEPARAIDNLEHDLSVLRGLMKLSPDAARGRAHYLLRLNESLRRSVIARWARDQQLWKPQDGLVRVSATTRDALARQRLGARPYSLSALQRFAVCPYQFVLSAIYRLEPAKDPEPLQRMDPLTRGSLFHAIQAEFFRTMQREGRLPIDASGVERAVTTLDAAVDRLADQYREDLAPAIDRVWRDEIAVIRKDLRIWVRRLSEEPDWEPWRFEFGFGLPVTSDRDPSSLADPIRVGGRFLLRGSVDLIERARAGPRLRVTDHKTGKDRSTPRLVIGGGTTLQPVLYSVAIAQALEAPVVEGRLFYCTTAGGFHAHAVPIDDRTTRVGLEALEIVDRAIELGFLPPAPAEKACAWCDFRPVCGPHEEQRLRRKPADTLGDLQALRERE